MPDILGATNPVPGQDRANVNRNIQLPPDSNRVQNVIDPSRVGRTDNRTEQQDNNLQGDGKIRYDSHFQVFLKRLRSTPDAAESLRKIFSGQEGFLVFSGIQEGTATDMAELVQLLKLDESQLLEFLQGQIKSGSQFGGALFALLRGAYAHANSDTVRTDILRFLKCYADYFSSEHLQGNLIRGLHNMAASMPASYGEKLNHLTAQLENILQNQPLTAEQRQEALQLLQRGIVPFMAKYTTLSHDLGTPRELLSLLMLDLARFENSDPEKLLEAFHQMKSYGTLKRQLDAVDDRALMALLERGRADQNSAAVKFADRLAQAAENALNGNSSADTQQALQEVIRAILINESVYMPLNHYLIPLEMNGHMLFSELWVDPDAEDGKDGKDEGNGKSFKCLFKMDVENLGMMDIILVSQGENVDLQVSCSERVMPFANKIEAGVEEILRRNELNPKRVKVRKMDRPVSLTEVFPKIFERRDSLNVQA